MFGDNQYIYLQLIIIVIDGKNYKPVIILFQSQDDI